MAQITSSRSEFMTSDLGLSDIEYKRKGGCYLSYNKVAAMIIVFIVSAIVAGFIGAYVSPWNDKRSITPLALIDEDEVNGAKDSKKFVVSYSINPVIYTVELTPVIDEILRKFNGRVIIEFVYNGSLPISKLVLNAKGITVSSAKLFHLEDTNDSTDVYSRKMIRRRREDAATVEASSFDSINSSDVTTLGDVAMITNPPSVVANDTSSTDDYSAATSIDIGNNITTNSSSDSSNENVSNEVENPSLTTTIRSNFAIVDEEKIESSSETVPSIVRMISPSTVHELAENREKLSKEISIVDTELDTVDEYLVIHLNAHLSKGSYYSVDINYEAEIDERYTFADHYDLEDRKRWLSATKLKPFGGRTLFPGFHEHNSRSKFSLSIARPKTFVTLFNTPLRSSDSISDNWTMDRFEISPPLSPDGLAFVVSDLKPAREISTGDNSNATLTLWGRNMNIGESDYVSDKLSAVTRLLSEYFSTNNPLRKLDVAAIPRLVDDGSGSIGLVFVKESLFDVTEESSSISKERTVMKMIKLIGEQWLGGLVSTKSWTDAWFLDGTLIYLQYLLADKIDPEIDPFNSFGILKNSMLEMDSYRASKSLKSRKNLASFEAANLENTFKKGACLIRMMHGAVLSESGFRNGYKNFLAEWRNAESDLSDFFVSMSNEANWLPDGISFGEAMMPWIDQSGFPVVTVTRNYEARSAVVRQEQFLFDDTTTSNRNQSWYIPVTYIIDNGSNEWSSPYKFWLKKGEEMSLNDVGIKEENRKWILFNVNQTGYYRVNYDEDNWKLLSKALNSTSNKFPVTTRTSLVDDALSLAWGGRLGYSTAFNLINYLREYESHHSPWSVAFQNMVKLDNLLYDTRGYRIFQEFMIKFISPLFDKVRTSSADSELKLMAIRWACLIDNPSCRRYMKSFSRVPDYLEETYRCATARFGGKSEWDYLVFNISDTKDEEIKLRLIAALPCFQVEWILQSILEEILKGEKFNVEETIALLKSFNENPMAARSAFKFMRRNWEKIYEKYSKSYRISRAFLLASIKGIADDQDLKEFQIFKEEHREKLRFMGHTIAIAEGEARSRSNWLKTNFLTVQRSMEEFIERTS